MSPVQKIAQRADAMTMPKSTSTAVSLTRLYHPGLKTVDRMERVRADPVIIHQNGICGAVIGENITAQRNAARITIKTSFFMIPEVTPKDLREQMPR